MKPKTAFRKRVSVCHQKLSPITTKQIDWGLNECFDNQGIQTKHKSGCLECGHSWTHESNHLILLVGCECPNCGKELKMTVTSKKKYHEITYFAILTVIDEFQVVRMMCLTKYCKIGTKAEMSCVEVMQHWINSDGKTAVYAKNVNGFSNCYDAWAFWSNLELRGTVSQSSELRNSITAEKIYPNKKVLDIIKRNGFKGHFYNISPVNLFKMLLTDSKAETLIKSNQISMLKYYYGQNHYKDPIGKYWNSVKICIRNNYIISDAQIWVDYVNLLNFFNKDLLSSHYICPVNLKFSHDKLVKKKREIQNRKKIEQMRIEIAASQIEYQKEKGKFFGISFTDGSLTVKVLETVEEFQKESEVLKHCLFYNEYFKKPDSLVLSARIEDNPVETVEISLSSLKILQSRGQGNKITEYHSAIIELVNSNLNAFSKLI